ncbi:gamma-glutamyl-gamma-aminobutyrate hydrolase [Knoellia locipacati]|uniref:Putative glutamine amidotransferase n=1 Tax=Knoellia locipacati TaxID=882824 RepID=A0A512SW23_9MICO|nr:gamma-glutamyl-gamma-aminobutyrate hydrolase family protein [Knoellia locipacati]GEQ12153.1 putative glutamine amidotransferase [Knoellia locipacati]
MTAQRRRPVIGVTSYVEPVVRGDWSDQPSTVLPHNYVEHLERAGAIAVVLPPRLDADEELVEEVLSRLDGVVIAGGADVEPSRYAAVPHESAQAPRPDRDGFEIAVAAVTARTRLPLLGICRGMQVMAVAAGGTLEQHVPDRVGHTSHSPSPGVYASHHVSVVEGTRLASILGIEPLDVPTYHHQAVATHPGYAPGAWHEDGTLEAMEDPAHPFRLAVQWHPEAGEDGRLFDALVVACRDFGELG